MWALGRRIPARPACGPVHDGRAVCRDHWPGGPRCRRPRRGIGLCQTHADGVARQPGRWGRFVWYNPDGTARLWTEVRGDLLTVTSLGHVGIGTSTPRTPLHTLGRISTGQDFTSAGAITFFPPDGFAWFHIYNGPAGGRPIGRLRFSYEGIPGISRSLACSRMAMSASGRPRQLPSYMSGAPASVSRKRAPSEARSASRWERSRHRVGWRRPLYQQQ